MTYITVSSQYQHYTRSNQNTLQRADAIAEERIYSAANAPGSDSATVGSYLNLTSLRASFDELVGTINKIGQLDKQARDLETKVDQEVGRVSANNFDRLLEDLQQVQQDNAKLVVQLKKLKV